MINNGLIVTSKQNRRVIDAGKLSDRREREERQLFRFDGVKLFCEAVKKNVKIDSVFIRASAYDTVKEKMFDLYGIDADRLDLEAILLSDDVFGKISEEKSPEGIITIAKYLDKIEKKATINIGDSFFTDRCESHYLLCDSLRDPGNMGAVMRSAAAFGVDRIVFSSDCADVYNPKTIRAAMGALFSLNIAVVDSMEDAVSALRGAGHRVFAATLGERAVKLGEAELHLGDCALIGNEGHGLSQSLVEKCDSSLFIPMTEGSESLNASVAASVILWELCKAR